MEAMLPDSSVAVMRTRPRAIPLAMITMRKSTHGFPFASHMDIKIFTSIVQDSQNNIQPGSDSNSASNSDSDRVERVVGSSSYSTELNVSGDQAAEART